MLMTLGTKQKKNVRSKQVKATEKEKKHMLRNKGQLQRPSLATS